MEVLSTRKEKEGKRWDLARNQEKKPTLRAKKKKKPSGFDKKTKRSHSQGHSNYCIDIPSTQTDALFDFCIGEHPLDEGKAAMPKGRIIKINTKRLQQVIG